MTILSTPNDPLHLAVAANFLGLKEYAGDADNPVIVKWVASLGGWWSNDSTPWCGAFVANVLKVAGLPIVKHWYRALAWAEYGNTTVTPQLGCIAVLERKGGGHVAFVAGETTIAGELHYVLLGGNQGDKVSLITVKSSAIKCFRTVPDGLMKHEPTKYTREFLQAANASTGGQYA